tara:strand:- start:4626 stop:5927 length:1302 start_codon:yes stop_codon:yes gene_type:complete
MFSSTKYLSALSIVVALLGTGCSGGQSAENPTDVCEEVPIDEGSALRTPDAFTAVIGQVVGEELYPVLGSDNKWHIVYELMLTNGRPIPASIQEIKVLDYYDNERVLRSITETEIIELSVNLSGRPRLEPQTPSLMDGDAFLQPNESMVVFIELAFDSIGDVPDAVVHQFSGSAATNPGSSYPQDVAYLMVPHAINKEPLPLVGAPLQGDNWVVINGCCSPAGAHRGSIQTISGRLRVAQRFAIDWMKIGDNGMFFEGDPTNVENWHNYGEPVLAVADGTVIEVLDELDDQSPGSLPDPSSITIETVDGNHVILDIGGGTYVFYAHLKRGSVSVAEGDNVRQGEVIGELGNSGNTSAPHLHIHYSNNPSALAADGIPYRYREFTAKGQVEPEQWESTTADLDEVWNILLPLKDMPAGDFMPLDLDVGSFSASP